MNLSYIKSTRSTKINFKRVDRVLRKTRCRICSGIINKLEMTITQSLIIPCLEENGLLHMRPAGLIDPETDEDDPLNSDDDDESEEETEES